MPLKLIMTWDIDPEQEAEYLDFLLRKFLPRMSKLGFELTETWATVYGEAPEVEVCALLPDELEAEQRMAQKEWKHLIDALMDYVENFEMKLVPAKKGFQF